MQQTVVTAETLSHLPLPVRRSLARSGLIGRPVPEQISLRQEGEILLRGRWMPFTADERFTVRPPSFQWNAVVKAAGVPFAWAEDSLDNGRGRMHVRLLRLFTVVDESGPAMDQGSLMRWLNETMWFPHVWATEAITWTPVDETTALGAMEVGSLAVQGEFRFDDEGRLVDFRADRYRIDDSGAELTEWGTPITGHARRAGIEVPIGGVGLWALESGDLEYIRLRVTDISYI